VKLKFKQSLRWEGGRWVSCSRMASNSPDLKLFGSRGDEKGGAGHNNVQEEKPCEKGNMGGGGKKKETNSNEIGGTHMAKRCARASKILEKKT